MRTSSIIATIGGLALASPALADDVVYEPTPDTIEEPGMYSYQWSEPRMVSVIGVGVIVGGGISGFTDSDMRDVVTSDVGGLWNLRVSLGTHIPVGLDISYVGTASSLETLSGLDNGTLIGTTVEGAVRWNILPHYAWTPYVFAGVGWQRYDVTDENFATSDTGMLDSDNLLEFPTGVGVAYRDRAGLVFDLRTTIRWATDTDLLIEPDGDRAQLHTWEASASLGYEF